MIYHYHHHHHHLLLLLFLLLDNQPFPFIPPSGNFLSSYTTLTPGASLPCYLSSSSNIFLPHLINTCFLFSLPLLVLLIYVLHCHSLVHIFIICFLFFFACQFSYLTPSLPHVCCKFLTIPPSSFDSSFALHPSWSSSCYPTFLSLLPQFIPSLRRHVIPRHVASGLGSLKLCPSRPAALPIRRRQDPITLPCE